MPSFNVSIPTLPKGYDHQDVTDNVDRKLLVAEQACALALQQLQGIQKNNDNATINGTAAGDTWAAGYMPEPNYLEAADATAYEAAVTAAVAALATALAQLATVDAFRAS
jgi:hypothetical protein